MPKHEAGTPKAIANKIKAKGLQKLRWYCQMCQKQCRDENGFKCHTMSESHQRQLLLFAENPDKYIDSFSKEFEDGFLELLKRRFGTKRVHANQVYQEYIADRHHLHMNATMWETLTDFVKWLGREGKCKVDQTEKGWFITYIDRDPDTIQRQEAMAKKEKMDKDDEEKMMEFINKQIVRAKEQEKEDASPVFTELQRTNEDEKVVISIGKSTKDTKQVKPSALVKSALTEAEEKLKLNKTTKNELSGKRKKTTLDEIMEEQEKMKERANRKDYWITEDIVVKVIAKSLGDKYYKKKGVIKEVRDRYQAVVKMIDSNDILKLDQAHLQTVIPAIGRRIKVVNGAYRDSKAVLKSIDEDHFCCTIQIDTGLLKGRVVKGVQYEDVCKLHSS